MRITWNHLFTLLTLLIPTFLSSQTNLNMTLQDSLKYNAGVNDVVGWAADDGSEYAIVGLSTGVSIVNVDSDTIREVVFVPGVNNLWRDINTYSHYAYVSTEASDGLTIIDLQFLPDSVQTYNWRDSLPTPVGPRPFLKAHTLWVDEHGILYLNGSNLNAGGVIMCDVATHPTDPLFLGYAPDIYSHDCYARDSILYSAEIYAGEVSIYDIHDPQNVVTLGKVKTPNEFSHNAWLSDDSRYMFTTDERSNSYVAAYDIQDPANIKEVDRFRQAATDGSGAIPHNVYVWNDWIVVAYYTNGTLIVDGSRPHNLIEVGSFDSFLGPHGGFSGVWGSYPFLPSGKILTSDRNSGLFVFIPTYVRAAFLEGVVQDSITKSPIQGARVTIQSDEIVLPQLTALDGSFNTGKAIPGTFDVLIRKQGYYPKTLTLDFVNGEVLTPLVELNPLPQHSFSGRVVDQNGNGVASANIIVSGEEGIFETSADNDGNFLVPVVYEGTYEVQAGLWGKVVETTVVFDQSQTATLVVENKYYDDFDLDFGWQIGGQVSEGEWKRGLPSGQKLFDNWQCGAPEDSPYDQGWHHYATGLSADGRAELDEVSGGTTILTSPVMDLTDYEAPAISFDYWLCEYPPNQYVGFKAWITNGVDTILMGEFSNPETSGLWVPFSATPELNEPLNNVQVIFTASDTTPGTGDYYLKVAVDHFSVTGNTVSTDEPGNVTGAFIIYPNPVNIDQIYLTPSNAILGEKLSLEIFDIHGKQARSFEVSKLNAGKGIRHGLEDGMYFIHWKTELGESGVEKIIVLRK